MGEILFEQPLRLLIAVVVMEICFFVVWKISSDDIWKKTFLIGILLSVLLVSGNVWVQTEREQLMSFLDKFSFDLEKKKLKGVLPHFDPKYNYEGVSYQNLEKQFSGYWRRLTFEGLSFSQRKFAKLRKGVVDVQFVCKGRVVIQGFPRPFEKNSWKFRVKKTSDTAGWKITRIEPLEVSLPGRTDSGLQLKELLKRRPLP